MALTYNNWAGIGRLTAEPELRQTASGKQLCNFTLAVPRPRAKDKTDFVRFTAWGQPATFMTSFAHKGDRVIADGPLESEKYTDKDGNERERWFINVQAISLESKSDGEVKTIKPEGNVQVQPASSEWEQLQSEDLPF